MRLFNVKSEIEHALICGFFKRNPMCHAIRPGVAKHSGVVASIASAG